RPDPGERVRQIAKTFAEEDRRRVGIERVRAHPRSTRAAPFDGKTDRHDELMCRVFEDAVLERRFEILESACPHADRTARGTQTAIGRAKRNGERLSDPL